MKHSAYCEWCGYETPLVEEEVCRWCYEKDGVLIIELEPVHDEYEKVNK